MTGEAGAPFVELAGLSRHFGAAAAVRDVSLTLERGEIVALLGPSGCGKSTLLRLIAGLEAPSAGEVRIEGRAMNGLPPYRRPVSMMFQSYALFPHMTVEQNVGYGLRQQDLDRGSIAARTDQLLELVRMTEFRRRRPDQLSGGQQQRVALARSLAREPSLLLLDEPMGALDRKLRSEMQFELGEILRRVRMTCLMVTHDGEEAMTMADRLALMRAGEVVQAGGPRSLYEEPVDRFAAEFLGPVNFLAGTVAAVADGIATVDLAGHGGQVRAAATSAVPGTAVVVAVRPERLRLGSGPPPAGNGLAGTVEDLAYLGTHSSCRVRVPGLGLVLVREPPGSGPPLAAGSQVTLSWDPPDARLLPP